jgi:hypothetical protein
MLLISSLTCGRSLGRVSLGFLHGLQQAQTSAEEDNSRDSESMRVQAAMNTWDPVNKNAANKESS